MFTIEKSNRPDRCELCRHSICVTVSVDTGYVPVSMPGFSPNHWADRYKT